MTNQPVNLQLVRSMIGANLFLSKMKQHGALTLNTWGAMLSAVQAKHNPKGQRVRAAVHAILYAAKLGYTL